MSREFWAGARIIIVLLIGFGIAGAFDMQDAEQHEPPQVQR